MEKKSPAPSEETVQAVYPGEPPTEKGTIALPVHLFDLSIMNDKKVKKMFFQFEVAADEKGNKVFSLVAYTGMKNKEGDKTGKWEIGKRIVLPVKEGTKPVELPLPLTLGNLELSRKEILGIQEVGILTFKPVLYTQNAHATYALSDGISQTETTAHPSPPAPPYEGDDSAS
jgi:hypothetical protein